MNKNQILVKTVEDGQGKIGIVFDEQTCIVLPLFFMDEFNKSINEISAYERKKLKLMVKAWTKFQKRNKALKKSNKKDNDTYYDFDTVLKIVKDFAENGLYTEFEKIDRNQRNGKIDFLKTIKRCKPLLTEQGSIYLSYITQIKKINDEEIIKSVQTLVLNQISSEIGWLIGFNIHLPSEGINFVLNNSIKSKLILSRDLSFNSRKIQLINLLLDYIDMQGSTLKERNSPMYVGRAYKFWEDIVSDTLSNIPRDKMRSTFYIRHAYINKKNSHSKKVLDPLMPDAVYKDEKRIYILDAKYYSKGNKPGNDDITKQFAYMAKAFNVYKNEFVYKNYFILPTDTDTYLSDENIYFDVDITGINEYKEIEMLYVNFEELINLYVNDKKSYKLLK